MSIILLLLIIVLIGLAFFFSIITFADAIRLRMLRKRFLRKGDPTAVKKELIMKAGEIPTTIAISNKIKEERKEPSVAELQAEIKRLEEESLNNDKYIPEENTN